MPAARYSRVSSTKASGATYTPPGLARFVAEQVARLVASRHSEGRPIRLLDPAVGDGELLVQGVEALRAAGFSRISVAGYDVDATALSQARSRLAAADLVHCSLVRADFLSVSAESPAPDPLFASLGPSRFDVVLANPPYVRTQVLGSGVAQVLAERHGLTGRVDLYHAFMVALADWMVPGGIAGVITSNRYLSVKAGAVVRRHLWSKLRIHHVWDLGDTRCFDAAVLPAVTLFEQPTEVLAGQATVPMTTIYSGPPESEGPTVPTVFDALALEGTVRIERGGPFEVVQGTVQTNEDGGAVWRLTNPAIQAWLARVATHTWRTFGQVGKIRVGIKTTADAVFIRDDWHKLGHAAPELLRPLTTHHVGRRFRAKCLRKAVLYTHEVVGGKRRAVDLAAYPHAAAYLEQHRERLAGRSYVRKANRAWYEIWVPQDPTQWSQPKLVFRDITDLPQFWVDTTGSVVNGDCYWMTANGMDEDVLWLAAAVGNSSFICRYYDACFNNKLYAGRRRFITQYVRQFPLPDPSLEDSRELIRLAKAAAQAAGTEQAQNVQRRINVLVERCLGV